MTSCKPSICFNRVMVALQTIAANEQYAVSDPAAGILGDSEEYIKNGVALDKIIEDAMVSCCI